MLKLGRSKRTVGYAACRRVKHGIGRTNPYNAACNKISIARRVYKNRSAMLKVVPVALVNFFTCLDWAVFYSHSTDGRAVGGAGKEAF
ncbi:hypothetical protein [Pseudomonas sp. MYb118]|uniref:hypothetical protein n=1 Tax=Pseudomonas sp. MYb118 TaxID=1848720 RepID=UPI0034CDDEAF